MTTLKAIPKKEPAKKKADPRYCSVEDAIELANNWSDEFLRCRSGTYNHEFRHYVATLNKRGGYIYKIVRCQVCDTKKHFLERTRDGSIVGTPYYQYPPGYQSNKGRILGDAKNAVRKAATERLIPIEVLSSKDARQQEETLRPSLLKALIG